MHLRIDHATRYAYDPPARSLIQTLRLTPRDHAGQAVLRWDVEVDIDARLTRLVDAYGNIVHRLQSRQTIETLTLKVTGEVETSDTAGVLTGQAEPLPPAVFLRPSPLAGWDEALDPLMDDLEPLNAVDRLHRLMATVHQTLAFDVEATSAATDAGGAFRLGRGVCQDFAHVFIAGARRLGAPARYVSGHLFRRDGSEVQPAAHAWAEAWVADLGWIGFDPTNGVCPDDAYVRVAVGPDYLDAAPVRGSSLSAGLETLSVEVAVRQAAAAGRRLSQSQRQD